tara:strand:- start:216 stop:713 length:498 start_codon:yes stop_codon:yes gene_type:complete
MAVERGIGSINGISIANIGKIGVVEKANMWSKCGQQEQASLFRSLLNGGWQTYSQGKNNASFTCTSENNRTSGRTYFQYIGNNGRMRYEFTFNKSSGTNRGEWLVAASLYSDFRTLIGSSAIDGSGNITASFVVSDSTSAIYLGIVSSPTNSQSSSINNLIVSVA